MLGYKNSVNRIIVAAIALISIFSFGRVIVNSLDGSSSTSSSYDNSQAVSVSSKLHSLSAPVNNSGYSNITSNRNSSMYNPIEIWKNKDASTTTVNSNIPMKCVGKKYPLSIVLASKLNEEYSKRQLCDFLPDWSQYTALYGDQPVIVGLETCEEYRSQIAKAQQPPRVRVAGLYNSGTNAFAMNLGSNFESLEESDNYTVPWSKHMLPEFRSGPFESWNIVIDPDLILPLVLVRDPLLWMKSMVRKMEYHKYCHLLLKIMPTSASITYRCIVCSVSLFVYW
jgi:hypothetical protein